MFSHCDIFGHNGHRLIRLATLRIDKAHHKAAEGLSVKIVALLAQVERLFSIPWPEWTITTRLDTSAAWRQVWQAVTCDRSQLPNYRLLQDLPDDHHRRRWGSQTYYRVFSLVNGGDQPETDLFAGLRGRGSISLKRGSQAE